VAARPSLAYHIILPRHNQKDLRDLPENVRADTEFIFADRVEDVLTESPA